MTLTWHNGHLVTTEEVSLPWDSPAFRYGVGLFETVLWNGDEGMHWELHIRRLRRSIKLLRFRKTLLPAHDDLHGLASRSLSPGSTGRANILVWLSEENRCEAALRVHPYELPDMAPVYLSIEHATRPTGQSRLKSASYGSYWCAWKAARSSGFHDAIVLDDAGRLLEATRGSLLFQTADGHFCAPPEEQRLASIALSLASQVVTHVALRPIRVDSLQQFQHAWYCNSLLGALPVARIGSASFRPDTATSTELRKHICGI